MFLRAISQMAFCRSSYKELEKAPCVYFLHFIKGKPFAHGRTSHKHQLIRELLSGLASDSLRVCRHGLICRPPYFILPSDSLRLKQFCCLVTHKVIIIPGCVWAGTGLHHGNQHKCSPVYTERPGELRKNPVPEQDHLQLVAFQSQAGHSPKERLESLKTLHAIRGGENRGNQNSDKKCS